MNINKKIWEMIIQIMIEKKDMIYYTTPGLSDDSSNSYIIGNQLTEQGTEYKVGKTVECITHAGEYATAIPMASYGINAAAKSAQLSAQAVEFSAQATQLTAQATQFSAQAAQITKNINNASKLTRFFNYVGGTGTAMAREAAELSSKASSATAAATSAVSSASASTAAANSAAIAGTVGKVFGIGLTVVGIVVGVGCGAYFTHKFCEETLDKFVEYYKKNSGKIKNSYIEAAEYFLK
jgi:hypothetical protein